MHGTPISVAKQALKLFIKSLPLGSRFNVISFGSDFSKLFENLVDYTKENVELALSEVEQFDADMGGTEIYQPLFDIYQNKDQLHEKQIYLITDGQIANED